MVEPMADDDPPTREELLKAREDIQQNLYLIENPIRGRNRNRPLVARLRGMLAEIDECLADLDSGDAKAS
jgi:hypothetical protein